MDYIDLSREQVNREPYLSQLYWITNDGQGDTNMWQLTDLWQTYLDDEHDVPTMDKFIDLLWEDTNGNMSMVIYITDNKPYRLSFKDWD